MLQTSSSWIMSFIKCMNVMGALHRLKSKMTNSESIAGSECSFTDVGPMDADLMITRT